MTDSRNTPASSENRITVEKKDFITLAHISASECQFYPNALVEYFTAQDGLLPTIISDYSHSQSDPLNAAAISERVNLNLIEFHDNSADEDFDSIINDDALPGDHFISKHDIDSDTDSLMQKIEQSPQEFLQQADRQTNIQSARNHKILERDEDRRQASLPHAVRRRSLEVEVKLKTTESRRQTTEPTTGKRSKPRTSNQPLSLLPSPPQLHQIIKISLESESELSDISLGPGGTDDDEMGSERNKELEEWGSNYDKNDADGGFVGDGQWSGFNDEENAGGEENSGNEENSGGEENSGVRYADPLLFGDIRHYSALFWYYR
jgi:hypothetical protein